MTRIRYMVTASGDDYALNGPKLGTPKIEDIAHHLAQINRFTGAARRPESVAEHSLLCDDIAQALGWPIAARRCVFAHDWHEAYTHDISAPVKGVIALMTNALSLFEQRHQNHVLAHFGLRLDFETFASDVRRVDLIALATERRSLMPAPTAQSEGWRVLDGVEPWGVSLMTPKHQRWTWLDWRGEFLDRYAELWAA
jgi:5'-deoxynucleotidase YfbR-like HD superfamily hydrolase